MEEKNKIKIVVNCCNCCKLIFVQPQWILCIKLIFKPD